MIKITDKKRITYLPECDKLKNHTIVRNNMIEGNLMDKSYIQYETMQNGMKIIMEVPVQSKEDETAKQEVRKILTTVLTEYLQKIS